MIPRVIHYCWFGGKPLPNLARHCIASWKKYCPNYEIKCWNEDNFNVHCNTYCSSMFEQKRWAFLTDYVRLKILYSYGGIYFDTDVELLKPIDDLLVNDAFMGIEDSGQVATGLGCGSIAGHSFVKENLNFYEKLTKLSEQPPICTNITTQLIIGDKYFLPIFKPKSIKGVMVYPKSYFCPMDFASRKIHIKKITYSIHHFSASWLTEAECQAIKREARRAWIRNLRFFPYIVMKRLLGKKVYNLFQGYIRRI